jgi:acetyl esterase/lipase
VEIDWLESLETRVRDAVARLGELNEENGTLRDRIRNLETEAAARSLPPALPFQAKDDEDRDEEIEALRAQVRTLEANLAAAETERQEVRRRVRLAGLMEA